MEVTWADRSENVLPWGQLTLLGGIKEKAISWLQGPEFRNSEFGGRRGS